MNKIVLFQARDGKPVSNVDVLRTLEAVGAGDADSLYVHSHLCFGVPNPQLPRRELLAEILKTLQQLRVPTLFVPTFTFSFCNGVDFDIVKSRSRMGAFNEFVRTQPDAVRSRDPLMSVAGLGRDVGLLENPGRHSIGADSTFDRLRKKGGTRFLFLGASPSDCMTYVHFVEERLRVPYRYDRDFTGSITDATSTSRETFTLFVRYRGIVPSTNGALEKLLLKRGLMKRAPCGDTFLSAVDEPAVFDTLSECLAEDIDYLLEGPHPRGPLDRHFEAHDMVAL
jgi:aminoglycoside 3-N-acetyltransferase